uniref:Ran gtpase-activating protein n=1 Tax=Macrostomum lignano TaxID=282301 RepID=A0A1I8FWR0_9PLAT
MNNEGLGHQGCRLLSDALSRGIDASEAAGRPLRLREFSAGRNRLENAGVDMLAGPLSRMASLRKLELYQDGIGIHGPRAPSSSPPFIKPDGAQLLADALRKLPKLTELNLADCLLLSDGAQAIADALDEALCPSLRSLIISGNEINRDAALAVAAAAAGKPTGLSIGGGGAGNRSLFDNVPELGLSGCSLFGGGSASSKPAAPAGSGGGVVAFSFKAAAAVTPAAEKPAGSEVGQPLLRPGRLSAGGGRSDGESSAAASLVDRLLTSPATFKLGEDGLASLGPEPGP